MSDLVSDVLKNILGHPPKDEKERKLQEAVRIMFGLPPDPKDIAAKSGKTFVATDESKVQ